jgi:hypothetical protein
MIEYFKMEDCKKVTKPWGHELWISPGAPKHQYALKEIFFKAGNRTSLQVHQYKSETNYVLSGHGHLLYHPDLFDFDRFHSGNYTKRDIDIIISELQVFDLIPGVVCHVWAGCIHRVMAIEDLTFIETSTVELDDVYRLQDDTNRTHGLIRDEHF